MNTNTVAGFIGGTGVGQIASQTLASTTETEFHENTGASPATQIAVLRPPLLTDIRGSMTQFDPAANAASKVRTGNRFGNPYFNVNNLDGGVPFLIRICGLATPASDAGNALQIFLHLSATKAGTALAQTADTNQASTTTAKPFILEAQMIWSSVTETLVGQFWWRMDATSADEYATWATLTNDGTSVSASELIFCASAQWGNAVGGVVAVSEFSMSRL